jgi:hypothetical protein
MLEVAAVFDWYREVYAHLRQAGVELVCTVSDAI